MLGGRRRDPPRIAVTGPDGFVAWHVRCAARARWGGDLIDVGRGRVRRPGTDGCGVGQADAVIHLAGVNRAHDPAEIERVNPWLAEQLVASLERTGPADPGRLRQLDPLPGRLGVRGGQAQGRGHPAGGFRAWSTW